MSQLRLRPSVLDHYPVPHRGVEPSSRSSVPVSSPFPLYHATRAGCPVSLAGTSPVFPFERGLEAELRITPSVVWGCLCYSPSRSMREWGKMARDLCMCCHEWGCDGSSGRLAGRHASDVGSDRGSTDLGDL